MSDKNNDQILNHEYDGIKEYDNPLPNWWLATFYGAIVFSIFYFGYYHLGDGPSPEKELEDDMAAIRQVRELQQKAAPPLSESDLLAVYGDSSKRQAGGEVYGEKCASCHGAHGEGMIGPNLTDKFWIHGNGSALAIFQTVSEGVPDKGMPPWKVLLGKEELQNVVAYVKSLKGTHPANAKAPQGNEVKEN